MAKTSKLSKSTITARNIIATARDLGWDVYLDGVNGKTLTIQKAIKVNDRDDFVKADSEWFAILGDIPGAGSVWGTDGGSVGGHAAMHNGMFVMHKTGVQTRIVNALRKELGC